MSATLLTAEGFQRLQDELNHLRNTRRKEVADRLHEAMEGGELIEDAEYEAAKNEQAFVEGRIIELETLLANARVIDSTGNHDVVQVGAVVKIQENGSPPEEYTIVGRAEANPRAGRISNESPIGRALLEHKKGDEVVVSTPNGSITVKILEVR